MSEQDAAATEQQTADTPDQGTGTQQDENWKERYDNLQADHTRAAQEAAQLRQWQEQIRTDPEAQKALLAELGYAIEDDTQDDEQFADDPVAALRQEFSTLKEQWQAEQQAAAEQAQLAQAMQAGEAHIAQEFNAISRTDLTDEDQAWIISRALSLPADQAGLPDIKTAFKEFEAFEERRMKQWAASKRTTHRVSPSGGAGEAVPDTAKHDGRVELMLSRLQDAAD